MLLTILQELQGPDVKFTVVPKLVFDYPYYSKLGIFPKVIESWRGVPLRWLGKFIPGHIRQKYGLINDYEVDVIIDASGFRYSSQWGKYSARKMARDSLRWRKMGKKIVLMPQAFGPFTSEPLKNDVRQIIDNSCLVYARDKQSAKALQEIAPDKPQVKSRPDFTVLFEGATPSYYDEKKHEVCIVPNMMMKNHTIGLDGYISFCTKAISFLQSKNISPYFLIQGGPQDKQLADQINATLDFRIEVICDDNPVATKGMIKAAKGMIGSRYHAIASALYTGTPVLGTSWSHKYTYLFQDFDSTDSLLDLTAPEEKLMEKLENYLCDAQTRQKKSDRLLRCAKRYAEESRQMFAEIKDTLSKK